VEISRREASVKQMWKRLKDDREEPEEWETISGREEV